MVEGAERVKQLELAGRGARAEVYKGLLAGARGVQKAVAIKRLRPELRSDASAIELFVGEARLAVQLAHPNVVAGLELAQDGAGYYLLCEWLSGATLAEVHARTGPLPAEAILTVAHDLCEALAYLHELRAPDGSPLAIVHRDVTPANIFVTESGLTKLGDFGVACWRDHAAVVRPSVAGTPGFSAPEQERGEAEPRCDIYGLGATLAAVATDLPAPIREVLERATATDCASRPPNARALRDALDAAARAAGVEADRRPLIERVSRSIDTAPARPRLDGALQTILGSPTPASATPLPARPRRRGAPLGWIAVGASVGLVAMAAWLWPASSPPPPAELPATPPLAVAPEAAPPDVIPAAREEAPRLRPVPRPPGSINLNSVPWAEVTIDGRRLGNTPLRDLELPAGRHDVVLQRPNGGERRSFSIDVQAGKRHTFVYDLARGSLSKRITP